jgi:hypothetical protein
MGSEPPSHGSYGLEFCNPFTVYLSFHCHHFQLPLTWRIWKEICFHETKINKANT